MHSSSVSSSTTSGLSAKDIDSIANYLVHEEIARGANSVIHRATCKRGRLRNRLVALKKTPIPTLGDNETFHAATHALQHTLHHPSITSLFSEFSTPLDSYQVLEFCPRGSLHTLLHSRRPSVLSEDELRVVVKGVVDALTYLQKQQILHNSLTPDHILLTQDLRPKLSGFAHAVRLPTIDSTASTFPPTSACTAPEILSRTPYSFSADVWSLGSVMLTCLHGGVFTKAFSSSDIPSTVAAEASDLISQMLQPAPKRRISLHDIHSHSFLAASSKAKPSLVSSSRPLQRYYDKENEPTPRPVKRLKYPALLSKGAPPSRVVPPTFTVGTRPLADIQNRDLRRVLSDEVSGSAASSTFAKRFASAPHVSSSGTKTLRFPSSQLAKFRMHSTPTTPALTDDTASVFSQEGASCQDDVPKSAIVQKSRVDHPLLSRPDKLDARETVQPQSQIRIDSRSSQARTAVGSGGPSSGSEATSAAIDAVRSTTGLASQAAQLQPSRRAVSATSLSPHVSTPAAISTAYLSPQTQKVAHGQLVVLPSKSLLVDFREGDRRRGKRGNEVLLISPDGATIQVYSAPHLSTPCCLAEPVATYALDGLPEAYRKAYEDAKRFATQLRQRIPKLVLYKQDVKCTLMANEPLGDIELIFSTRTASDHSQSSSTEGAETQMRVSLRRRRQAVEIERFVSSSRTNLKAGTGEWTRKVLPASVGYLCISNEDLAALDLVERAALGRLAEFLMICEALEAQEREPGETSGTETVDITEAARRMDENGTEDRHNIPKDKFSSEGEPDIQTLPPGSAISDSEDGTLATVATTASTRALPSIEVAPRPLKFSTSLQSRPRSVSSGTRAHPGYGTSSVLSVTPSSALPRSCTMPTMSSNGPPTRTENGVRPSGADHLETRFLPSVGWCTRSVATDSQSHKIMFQDGAVLQVDSCAANEEIWYAETPSDRLARLSAASAARTIAKRMDAYWKFVEMFRA